jgi:AraC family transcriptional regulator
MRVGQSFTAIQISGHKVVELRMNNNTLSTPIGNEAPHDLEDDQLLRGLSLDGLTSRGLRWTDYLVEELQADVTEREESVLPYASLFMWRGAADGRGELKVDGGRFKPYIKHTGFLSLFPAGQFPAVRTFTHSQFLVFAIRRSFMETLEIEMDRKPTEEMRVLTGFQDSGLRQLMSLLSAEAESGGVFGRLYADSLAQAIATRLLYFNEKDHGPSRCETSPLPGYLLQRVIERMRDLDADLDLRTLAAEIGYSQRHFIRMFRSATGQTPHRFLIQLRLDHAKRLLQQPRTSLIDVAAASGFSSHAHMTQVFRRVLGVTPSEFRSGL